MTRDDSNPNTDIDLGWTALLTAAYPGPVRVFGDLGKRSVSLVQ